MVAGEHGEKRDEYLIRVLVENKLISEAQANLIWADHENTGMSIDEILVARSWMDQKTILSLLPEEENDSESSGVWRAGTSFEDNLRKYRQLLAELLGESSE